MDIEVDVSDLICPFCDFGSVDEAPDSKYEGDPSWYDVYGFKDYGCRSCNEGFDIELGKALAKRWMQDFRMNNSWDIGIGQPLGIPGIVYYRDMIYHIEVVEVQESVVKFFREESDHAFSVSASSLDFKLVSSLDRKDLEHVNLDELFGKSGKYECRVCPRSLDDGRKKYCSDYCRENAYSFQKKYIWERTKEQVWEEYNGNCDECGRHESELAEDERMEVDHEKSVARGGSMHDPGNCVLLCSSCHRKKSSEEGDYSASSDTIIEPDNTDF